MKIESESGSPISEAHILVTHLLLVEWGTAIFKKGNINLKTDYHQCIQFGVKAPPKLMLYLPIQCSDIYICETRHAALICLKICIY